MQRVLILAAVLGLMLGGCGFKLRSYSLESNVESFYVDAPSQHLLRNDLRQGLRLAGAREADSASDAALIVELTDARSQRRSVSTTGSARAAEYELELGVQFRLSDAAGTELAAPRWVVRERVFRVDRANIVGNNEEQVLIEREMRAELVQAVVRAINAVSANQAAQAVDAG